MKGEKVWGKALEQLQSRIPRHVYETWFKDTVGLDLEGKVLIVGVANEYAGERLERECSGEIVHVLEEILGEKVTVQFSLIPEDGAGGRSSLAEAEDEEALELETRYLSVYDEMVRPERIIAIPRYYLRWIPWLGADLAWLPVGFRQAAYLHGCIHEGREVFEASAHHIARWSGMSRATFWRKINDPRLKWFIQPADDGLRTWKKGEDRKPHQAARQWRIVLSTPLTPADQRSLQTWLKGRLDEGVDAANCLRIALETDLEALLPWPQKIDIRLLEGKPMSIQEIVGEVLRGSKIKPDPGLDDLANKLKERILNRMIFVRHYFVEKWLPRLGAGPGWMITLLRSLCYYNASTGELRDTVEVQDGYAEIAVRLGLIDRWTVARWLRGESKRASWMHLFVNEADHAKHSNQSVSRRLIVQMVDPLTPEDQGVHRSKMTIKDDFVVDIHRENGVNIYQSKEGRKPEGKNRKSGVFREGGPRRKDTERAEGPRADETHRSGGPRVFETHRAGGLRADETHRNGGSSRSCDSLKDSLIKELNIVNTLKCNTTTLSGSSRAGEGRSNGVQTVVVPSWDLAELLSHNRVDITIRKALINSDATAEGFVSWLLYGASVNGISIKNPIGHAIDRLRKDPGTGAGKAFDALAKLSPDDLARLIARAVDGTARSAGNSDWKNVMSESSQGQLMNLACQLGIDVDKGKLR